MKSISRLPFFCSWSGGKDSCLALYYAIQHGGCPACLFTLLTEDGNRSRSHGLARSVLQQQARRLSVPLVVAATSWPDYQATFVSVLSEFKAGGIDVGVFGDIDIDSHRNWCERVCSTANIEPYHPLWKRSRRDLLDEFVELNFKATIIAVKEGPLGRDFLGKGLNATTVGELEDVGIDASGEGGEYHTVVTDGPIFSSKIHLVSGDCVRHDGYWFLDVSVLPEGSPLSLAENFLRPVP